MPMPVASKARPWAQRSIPFVASMALLSLAFAGCGPAGESRPEVIPVEGSLTINGKPAEGAMLVFHPSHGEEFDARGSRPRANVEKDGHFQVTTYDAGDGLPAGEYDVAVLWFDDPNSAAPHDKLGGRYAVPGKPELHISVTPETSQLEPLEIKGAKITSRRPRSNSYDVDQVD